MGTLETIPIVYGNHGRAPAQLEDYHVYLNEALATLGYQAHFVEEVVPGRLNILIEYFSEKDVQKFREALKTPGTRYICVATEFITGATFNDFKGLASRHALKAQVRLPKWMRSIGSWLLPIVIPEFFRTKLIQTLPAPYYLVREKYYGLFGYPDRHSIYANKEYWLERYRNFNRLVPAFESIWCVTPHQIGEYENAYGSKVKLMPIAAWAAQNLNSLQGQFKKDIDFLFTGSATPYRSTIFDALRKRGYNVFVGPATLPTYLREHFIARSKVCLQVRQDGEWKYPSIMRYHYLLRSGCTVVAEQTEETCDQEQFIKAVAPEDFIETCVKMIESGDYVRFGAQAAQEYYNQTAEGRAQFASLLPMAKVNENGKVLESPQLNH